MFYNQELTPVLQISTDLATPPLIRIEQSLSLATVEAMSTAERPTESAWAEHPRRAAAQT